MTGKHQHDAGESVTGGSIEGEDLITKATLPDRQPYPAASWESANAAPNSSAATVADPEYGNSSSPTTPLYQYATIAASQQYSYPESETSSTSMFSTFSCDSSQTATTATTVASAGQEGPLVCEFRDMLGCDISFSADDTETWIAHIAWHMGRDYPHHSVCWFCNVGRFQSPDSESSSRTRRQTGRQQAFESRLRHVAEHLVAGEHAYTQLRPDYEVIRHMHKRRLIGDDVFAMCIRYTEVPEPLASMREELMNEGYWGWDRVYQQQQHHHHHHSSSPSRYHGGGVQVFNQAKEDRDRKKEEKKKKVKK